MKRQQTLRGLMGITGALLILSFQNCAKIQSNDLRAAGITTSVDDLSAVGNPGAISSDTTGTTASTPVALTPEMPPASHHETTTSSGAGGGSTTTSTTSNQGAPQMNPPAPEKAPEPCVAWDPKKVQASLGKKHDEDGDEDHDEDHDGHQGIQVGHQEHSEHGSKSCDHKKTTAAAPQPAKVCAPDASRAVAACLNAGKATASGDTVANKSGFIVIDAENMRSIENLRGSIIIRGTKNLGRVDMVKNLSGSVVLCNLEVGEMNDISGHLVLVNTTVKHLENQRGNRLLSNSNIASESNVSGHLAQNH